MEKNLKIGYDDLSGWLKFAFVWTMIEVGISAFYLIIGFGFFIRYLITGY
jgi:hypothetical protein